MLKRNRKMLTAIATAIAITSNVATTTVYATSKNLTQVKLPQGYGIDSGKVTKELLELKLDSVKDDVKNGRTERLVKNVAKLKSYLEEAVANKEVNEKEAKDIMNEINELDKIAKGDKDIKKIEPSVDVKESDNKNNNQAKQQDKQNKLVKTGSGFDAGMLLSIGTTLSVAGTYLIKKFKK